jgi:hypothetical protein
LRKSWNSIIGPLVDSRRLGNDFDALNDSDPVGILKRIAHLEGVVLCVCVCVCVCGEKCLNSFAKFLKAFFEKFSVFWRFCQLLTLRIRFLVHCGREWRHARPPRNQHRYAFEEREERVLFLLLKLRGSLILICFVD